MMTVKKLLERKARYYRKCSHDSAVIIQGFDITSNKILSLRGEWWSIESMINDFLWSSDGINWLSFEE
jgi:hypothetical protein